MISSLAASCSLPDFSRYDVMRFSWMAFLKIWVEHRTRYVCEMRFYRNSLRSFCMVLVECVVRKKSLMSSRKFVGISIYFIAVLTVSIFDWNSALVLLNSARYTAMLPIMRPLTMELRIKIGMAAANSYVVRGQTSPTPNK